MIEVEEEGTTAAAATALVMVGRSSRRNVTPVTQFNINHPFIFFLRDLETGMLLFQGRIVDPAKDA